MWELAALAFATIFFPGAPFPLIIVTAAAIGFMDDKFLPEKFQVVKSHGGKRPVAA